MVECEFGETFFFSHSDHHHQASFPNMVYTNLSQQHKRVRPEILFSTTSFPFPFFIMITENQFQLMRVSSFIPVTASQCQGTDIAGDQVQ